MSLLLSVKFTLYSSFIVADPFHGKGLGLKMIDYMMEICRDKKIEKLYAVMLPDNHRAIKLLKELGFCIIFLKDDTVRAEMNLREE